MSDDRFEANLAAGLERRADGLVVQPNLLDIEERAATGRADQPAYELNRPSWAPRRWLPAAAVLVVGLIGVQLISRLGADEAAQPTGQGISTDEISAAGQQDESNPDGVGEATIIVWLVVGIDDQMIEAVRQRLELTDGVTDIEFVDQDKTYAEFRHFFADEPEILDLVAPEQLPLSFVVQSQLPELLDPLETMAAVEAIETQLSAEPCRIPPTIDGAIVWLETGVSDELVADVRSRLEQIDGVEGFSYIDEAETYRQFQEYFADEPEILDLVTPEQLPTSFEVQTRSPGELASLEALAAVDDVETRLIFADDC